MCLHCRHGSGKWQAITTDPDPTIGGALSRRSNVDLKVSPVPVLYHLPVPLPFLKLKLKLYVLLSRRQAP
jgi:hypothetical protein